MKLTNKIGVIVDSFRLPEREVGTHPEKDIRKAVQFIQRYRNQA
ncbi:hypothetical protein Back11_07850 [Paenibacillus baekrokdamisoli]|uniref:Uncharacterized protein n=1 Tax=Paenibacillus baekrokdamisoli TaxID=1712516 RepID=A0A3G9IKL4_9BACL|nr:hypothetical protein [Paenibacillus baekrokdamisoli]MBB3067373.1 hypothetical protein [Paenibacillus baekrokdamisoli]BBH19440.1 hypothetical protein Back11_07850 [Paenibacillus baekrokdamisoli]